MPKESAGDVTRLLADLHGAHRQEALDRLVPLVYDELRAMARARLRHERPDHTLQATALVHEAFVRMVAGGEPSWHDRRHFFFAASRAMRQILIEDARKRGRTKRGGRWVRITFDEVEAPSGAPMDDVLALDEAVRRLEEWDSRMAEVVELRFFAGLSVEETAKALGMSERTVKREWAVARAWLFQALKESRTATD